MSQLDMRDFYWINWPGSRNEFGANILGQVWDQLMSFSKAQALPSRPVQIVWHQGARTPSDVIWIGVVQLVVSARFIEVLKDFTGWTTFPVEVYDDRGKQVPGYEGLAITGRCDRVTHDFSRVVGDGLRAQYVGLQFSIELWDGADIFYPKLGPGPIVTAPLREALRRAKITNLRATQLPKVRMNKHMVDGLREKRRGPYADISQ